MKPCSPQTEITVRLRSPLASLVSLLREAPWGKPRGGSPVGEAPWGKPNGGSPVEEASTNTVDFRNQIFSDRFNKYTTIMLLINAFL